jgi:molybdate transport system substrate-binding protein
MSGVNECVRRVFQALGVGALLALSATAMGAEPLTVAVAANVKYAFDELAAEFRKETGIEAQGVFGSTGQLAAQVRNGAPFDILLAADTETPEALYQSGWTAGAPRPYAYGVLVLWTMRDFDLRRGMALLGEARVQKVAIPNPRLAPYGRAAMQALEHAGLTAQVGPKLVMGESIGQAAQFVESGAADIGFNAKSIVLAPGLANQGRWVEVPKGGYQPIAQAVVLLKHGEAAQPEAARKFIAFLFTPRARAIFGKYGYLQP